MKVVQVKNTKKKNSSRILYSIDSRNNNFEPLAPNNRKLDRSIKSIFVLSNIIQFVFNFKTPIASKRIV